MPFWQLCLDEFTNYSDELANPIHVNRNGFGAPEGGDIVHLAPWMMNQEGYGLLNSRFSSVSSFTQRKKKQVSVFFRKMRRVSAEKAENWFGWKLFVGLFSRNRKNTETRFRFSAVKKRTFQFWSTSVSIFSSGNSSHLPEKKLKLNSFSCCKAGDWRKTLHRKEKPFQRKPMYIKTETFFSLYSIKTMRVLLFFLEIETSVCWKIWIPMWIKSSKLKHCSLYSRRPKSVSVFFWGMRRVSAGKDGNRCGWKLRRSSVSAVKLETEENPEFLDSNCVLVHHSGCQNGRWCFPLKLQTHEKFTWIELETRGSNPSKQSYLYITSPKRHIPKICHVLA